MNDTTKSSPNGREAVRWPSRVSKAKVRRLYQLESRGILDDELIDDVGYTLYLRCRAILQIEEARSKRLVTCPRCQSEGKTTKIQRTRGARDELIICSECDWQITWDDYQRTFKRRQLNSGGAMPAFQNFIVQFDQARTPREKIIAIDRVIHEFHYSLKSNPDLPTRPAGVNLIEGDLTDVVAFLDQLSASDAELQRSKTEWKQKYQAGYWPGIIGDLDAE